MRSCLLCVALCGLALNAHASNLRWQHQPGVTHAGSMGILSADLDADGRDEAVFTAELSFSTPVLGIVAQGGSALALEQILVVDGQISTPIIAGRVNNSVRILAGLQQPDSSFALVEYGGRPLRELRRIPVLQWTKPLAIADIEGDGDLDILAVVSPYPAYDGQLAILDYGDGGTRWTDVFNSTHAISVQLDPDVPLELVIAGVPGRVLDGATKLEQWSYPPGFQPLLLEGEFEDDTATEFAATAGGGSSLTIFRAEPFSPLREISLDTLYGSLDLSVYDIDGDGRHEILFPGNFYDYGVVAYTPASDGRRTFPQIGFSPARVVPGNLDGASAAELILANDRNSYNEPDALRIVDSASNSTRFSVAQATGPYAAVALGDLDADGNTEVVHALAQPTEEYGVHRVLCVLDLSTGTRRRCLSQESHSFDASAHTFVLGNFGQGAGQDAAVIRRNVVTMYDGETFVQRWRREGIGQYFNTIESGIAMRFNADDIDDVVLLDDSGKLHVLDGSSGADLWQSVTLGGVGKKILSFANVDGDSATEFLVSTGETLYAFDAQTRLLDWSLTSDLLIDRVVVWGAGSACRFGLYNMDGRLRIHRCSDRTQEGSERTFPVNAGLLRALDPAARHFIVTSSDRLLTVAEDDSVQEWARGLGGRLGSDNAGTLITLGGDRYDVILGSDLGVSRVAVRIDLVFADTFE